jgi:hypothetical protein
MRACIVALSVRTAYRARPTSEFTPRASNIKD